MQPANHRLKTALNKFSAAAYLCGALLIAVAAYHQGLSQYFVNKARFSKSDADVSKAIAFDGGNPEAYKTRGLLFLRSENYREAADNFAMALSRQPQDYLLWLRLGYSREKKGEFADALKAYERSLSLAPNYAAPQRYTGRFFLRTKETEKAFSYLSRAAARDIKYLPEVLHLARRAYPQDPFAIERAVEPNSPEARRQLAFYFIKHDLISEKTRTFLLGDELEKPEKIEVIDNLIETENFHLAFDVWSSVKGIRRDERNLLPNGDFESEIDPAEKQFGWVINREAKNTAFKANRLSAYSNSYGLQIVFNGGSEPEVPLISHLVPVEPERVYRLSFAARAENLITGGLPVFVVKDAATGKILEQTAPLTGKNWNKYTFNFSTPAGTKAVKIGLQRLKCGSSNASCPIFGEIQLDQFLLSSL